ncbi:hypothetical protein PR048_011008 [Dryococelus australis]|uniref:Uncharacterized protein n=1 Tax=Dryococelus australis TaxID=614101 RepID=A0ABQ9HKP5_9NEOP|nr:hypothetical protein PR048_011008 [Dryococelus australis]
MVGRQLDLVKEETGNPHTDNDKSPSNQCQTTFHDASRISRRRHEGEGGSRRSDKPTNAAPEHCLREGGWWEEKNYIKVIASSRSSTSFTVIDMQASDIKNTSAMEKSITQVHYLYIIVIIFYNYQLPLMFLRIDKLSLHLHSHILCP